MTGYPWATGDALLAADLNAAFANGAGLAGGPFLPLIGGTVSGLTDFQATIEGTTFETYNHRIQTGGTLNTALGIYGELSGTWTGGNSCFSRINLITDTLAAGGGGLTTLLIDQHSGGVGTTGNRIGAFINFNFAGGTTNKGLGIGNQYGGLWSYATASGNVGGTTGAGNSWGELWGGISSATLASGATFWTACIGHEVDFGVSAGASAPYVQGLKIVLAHHNQAIQTTDYMIGMAKITLTDTNLGNGIAFGSIDGYWPFANTSTLIGTQASNLPTPPAMTAAMGVDFNAVTFGSWAFRSPGFTVDPSGNLTAAFTTSSGLNLGQAVAPGGIADLSRHIQLYSPSYGFNVTGGFINYVVPSAAVHQFVVAGAVVGSIGANGIMTGAAGGPTWTTGSAAPAATAPVGSLYSRVGGAVGATLYVSRGAGTWAAVAGV